MSVGIAAPFFPAPPGSYDPRYMAELVRNFALFVEQSRNPGPVRASELVLPSLPTSATGLASGTVWNDAGTLKVVP
jgi:hypothetical protein